MQLDAVCQRFEAEWSDGNQPCVSKFLDAASELPRTLVLKELLVTDIEQRSHQSTLESLDTYHEKFPGDEQIVDDAAMEAAKLGHWIPGLSIGRYTIGEPIGAGGMGRVFRATDNRLHREVAIKALPAEFCKASNWIAQCKKETALLSKMAHPNVVVIHDVDEYEGQVFFVMELLQGQNLSHRLAHGKMEFDEVDAIVKQIALGLGAIHELGIVHCDIKPTNIFVTNKGNVKLLDFGIANFESETVKNSTGQETSAGGTQPYMSPEQTRNAKLDARSDIFSFGSVIYELVTGVKAFARETKADTIAAVLKDNPLETIPASIPRHYKTIINRCLQKNPEARYSNLDQLLRDFNSPLPIRSSTSMFIWPIGLAATLLIVMLIWNFLPPKDNSNNSSKQQIQSVRKIDSLAILPFSGSEETELLSDGLTFSLIDELSGINGIRVRPYSAVQRIEKFDGNTQSDAIMDLMVSAVATGFIKQKNDEILIHVELIDTLENSVLWAKNYQTDKDDYLMVQQTIVDDLCLECLGQSQSPISFATTNLAAFENYTHGLVAWNRRDPNSIENAITYFANAVDLDPNYALAYAGLSKCYINQAERNLVATQDGFEMARQNALLALEKDEDCIDAQIVLAMISFEYDWKFIDAEERFQNALFHQGKPVDHATGHQWYAEFLSAMGRHQEANQNIMIAQNQDPTSAIVATIKGLIQLKANNLEEAQEQLCNVLQKNPSFDRARGYLIDVYELQDNYEKAIEQWRALADSDQQPVDQLKKQFLGSGPNGYWQARIDHSKSLSQIRSISKIFEAIPYSRLQNPEKAMEILREEIRNRNGAVAPNLYVHPAFDVLRLTKGFQELLAGIDFPDPN